MHGTGSSFPHRVPGSVSILTALPTRATLLVLYDVYKERLENTMIRRSEWRTVRDEATAVLHNGSFATADSELESIEVADFGLGRIREEEAQIATLALSPGTKHWFQATDDAVVRATHIEEDDA